MCQLEVTALTLELFRECVAEGMGGDDLTALVPNLRRKAGLEHLMAEGTRL